MVIVLALDATGAAPEVLDAQLAFHLAAGVDAVLVAARHAPEASRPVLAAYGETGRVHIHDLPSAVELAPRAVAEHAADWVLVGAAGEFWWPRGESLGDVLAVVPERYAVVQALERRFEPVEPTRPGTPEERTLRRSLLVEGRREGERPADLLRPLFRGEPGLAVDLADPTQRGRRVPLRAWYPIELLRFPDDPDEPDAQTALAAGRLVEDARLREALAALRAARPAGAPGAYALAGLELRVPTIVDDASYAVECAAVGEVDLVALDAHIRELELRIAALEAGFWPRVFRLLRRLRRGRR
ncbi:MAG TPA: hypothetical protein VNJ53_02360 [Gaiellaceae bacterium]|nr:hypothetical protein [Gaiellaceae bacterium]